MKKIVFDFLATMELKEIDKPLAGQKAGLQPADNAHFRLFSDGGIYPHPVFAQKEQLEYQSKDSSTPSYGYDVFLSTDWNQYDQNNPVIVCIAKVSKHLAKVDMFGRVKYDEDGKPKSDVLTQKNSSGEELIKMLEAAYCEEGEQLFSNGRVYVDLRIVTEVPVKASSNGVYLLPKKFTKGKDAGKLTYERRENIQIFPLEIVNFVVHPESIAPKAPEVVKQPPAAVLTTAEVSKAASTKSNNSSMADLGAQIFGTN